MFKYKLLNNKMSQKMHFIVTYLLQIPESLPKYSRPGTEDYNTVDGSLLLFFFKSWITGKI